MRVPELLDFLEGKAAANGGCTLFIEERKRLAPYLRGAKLHLFHDYRTNTNGLYFSSSALFELTAAARRGFANAVAARLTQ